MRRVLLISTLLFGFEVNAEGQSPSVPIQDITVVTMSKDGELKQFSEAYAIEIAAILESPLHRENYFPINLEKSTCSQVEEDLGMEVNYLLELPIMIGSLVTSKIPLLNESQKETLKRVPFCEPYLLDLKIIALQLDGWKLVKREILPPNKVPSKARKS
ncbi:MAG: hypothetical protein IPJ71_00505 [Bdellovibrionales bacterium]|nr:hypothetical protein [Bdellovibrionales bacterium]